MACSVNWPEFLLQLSLSEQSHKEDMKKAGQHKLVCVVWKPGWGLQMLSLPFQFSKTKLAVQENSGRLFVNEQTSKNYSLKGIAE